MDIEDRIEKYLDEGIKGKIKRGASFVLAKTFKGKPPWDDAPKWANYLVMMPLGSWVWVEKKSKPFKKDSDMAWPDKGKYLFSGFGEENLAKGDGWMKHIEKRP